MGNARICSSGGLGPRRPILTLLFYGHRPRWKTTSRTSVFFGEVLKSVEPGLFEDKLQKQFASKLSGLDILSRAQYLESKLLLGNYLLSSQGDRMAIRGISLAYFYGNL